MAVKVSGDYAKKLDRWQQLLNASSVIVKHASRAQAEIAITLIGEGFEDETDPYGRRWKKKQADDGRKILHGETSRLRTGWHVKATQSGWRVDPSVEYAAYHQAPRKKSRPRRMMVPSAARGIPSEWAKEFEAVAVAEAMEHFGAAANGSKPKVKTRKVASAAAASSGGSSKKRRGGTRTIGGFVRKLKQIRALARKAGIG